VRACGRESSRPRVASGGILPEASPAPPVELTRVDVRTAIIPAASWPDPNAA
jgi:hypothetical protein